MSATASTFASPERPDCPFKRAAILFAGGPAPAANAVISACAVSFLRHQDREKDKIEVIGIRHGYSGLVEYTPQTPLQKELDYIDIEHEILRRTRNSQGILIGTARTNPGKQVKCPADFDDPQKVAPLRRVYDGLRSLQVDCLVSIGGDDTLTSANKLKLFQDRLPKGAQRIPIVHVPKTIDNDLNGIDFTFGYFTAVDQLSTEICNLLHDAEAGGSYYLAETMGRSAGWLAYGAAIAGEASFVISLEDIQGKYRTTEQYVDEDTHQRNTREIINLPAVIDRIVDTIVAREDEGKRYGVIVMAEGLAELLPYEHLKGIPRDEHGHISIPHVNLGKKFALWVAEACEHRIKKGTRISDLSPSELEKFFVAAETLDKKVKPSRKITGIQLGYEARCAKPHAFDVMLGSQLGVGAYRALVLDKQDGVMVSVEGQLKLVYRKFDELVDPDTLLTKVRNIDLDSDFHMLARFLQTQMHK